MAMGDSGETHNSCAVPCRTNVVYTQKRSSATAKSTARPSCLVGVLDDIFREKICLWLINHFYVIGNESYRIRRNKAK